MAVRPSRRPRTSPASSTAASVCVRPARKNSRYDLGDVATSAKKKGGAYVIDGEKFVVLNGENADTLIVTARTKGAQRDRSGIGVFIVPANAKGVTRKGYPTQDGLHAADITLTGVEVDGMLRSAIPRTASR